jgi:transcriptional regulator with XRE-family HTH domain
MTDEMALNRIAANMRRYRELSGQSMGEIARRIDTYPATIERIENQKNMPGVGLLTRIADALSVTVNDLLDDPKNPPKPMKALARAS